jgi:hypothetical protein
VPRDGQSLFELVGPEGQRLTREAASRLGEGWRVPANPLPPDTDPADVEWATPKRVMQPMRTFEQPIRLTGSVDALPRSYIYCTRAAPGDVFRQFANRVQRDPAWQYREMDASHNPHITAPNALDEVLNGLLAHIDKQ